MISIRLAQSIGLKRVSKFAERFGIHNVSSVDLSIALGTTSATLLDLAYAYNCFHSGRKQPRRCILEIRTKDGEILYKDDNIVGKKIIDAEILKNCRKLLRGVIEFGSGRRLQALSDVYGKTGTNGDLTGNQDAWFAFLFSPQENKNEAFTMAVWAGNDMFSNLMTADSTGSRIPMRVVEAYLHFINFKNISKEPYKQATS